MSRRLTSVLVVVLAALALGGCGGEDAERLADDTRQRAEELRDRARERVERVRDRLRARIERALDELERAVPAASTPPPRPTRTDTSLERFLTEVLTSVDRYWTRTLTAAGRPEPRVRYQFPGGGVGVRSGCGAVADDDAAFYCPSDDTIYISQAFASDVLQGIREDFPGTRAGQGRAVGDFGVAYIVAHEYAHNVQQELGVFAQGRRVAPKAFELQADCMAGLWGNSVYREGLIEPGDVEEALSTAKAVGDFEYLSPQHHGTPDERRRAWLLGYRSGDPSSCAQLVAGV